MTIKANGGRSYLWREAFLTEPVGRWVSAAGHSFGWSLKRSDQASLHRVQRRASGNCQPVYQRSRPLPFSRSSLSSSFFKLPLKKAAISTIAITAISIQCAYAQSASTASICDPFNPHVLGEKLGKLWVLATAINFFVFLGALLVRDAFNRWIDYRAARGEK